MKALIAFLHKEWMEQVRSGKLLLLGTLFLLFGVMNPAVAKLTPWLMETMADSLTASGLIVTEVKVSALDSWVQFFKNMPMALIAFVLTQGGIFTREYESGTLVLALTKGLNRYKVVVAKTALVMTLWSLGYWGCFGITWGYNAWYWDNSVAANLMSSVVYWWLFGVWVLCLMVLFSTLAKSNSAVLGGTGAVAMGAYLLELLPKVKPWMPTTLMDGNSLIYAAKEPEDYGKALAVAAVSGLVCLIASVPIFNKKAL